MASASPLPWLSSHPSLVSVAPSICILGTGEPEALSGPVRVCACAFVCAGVCAWRGVGGVGSFTHKKLLVLSLERRGNQDLETWIQVLALHGPVT